MKLVFIHLKVAFFNLWEEAKVFFRYYRSLRFLWIDGCFRLHYMFINPYKICRRQGYLYGETPLTTMDHIAREAGIFSKDVVYDLGCGRGRNLFWLSHFIKCRTIGIDLCPRFINNGKKVKDLMKLHHMSFEMENVIHADYTQATVVYLYGTDFSDEVILQLIEKFRNQKLKIITVSFSLKEYRETLFEIKKEFQAIFPWGKADVYVQVPIMTF